MTREWHYWTRNKLEILSSYLHQFNVASQRSRERVYLDLMAGEPANVDAATGLPFDGSARRALSCDPGFTRLAFCEQKPRRARELEADLNARHPGAPWRIYQGDCNAILPQMLADLDDVRWAPTFAFLDQQAAEIRWETIERLARWKERSRTKVEQWILVSPAMTWRGTKGSNKEAFAQRVDAFYGSTVWRQIDAACQAGIIEASQFRNELVNLLRWRLSEDLGYRYTVHIPMRLPNHMNLYDMVFATDHEAGLKIMSHLYKLAAQREPGMRLEARDRAAGYVDGGLFEIDIPEDLTPRWKNTAAWDPESTYWWD